MTATTANILDPIQSELDQTVFRGQNPRPTVVSFIERKFFETMDNIVLNPEFYFELVMTGSLTTYQYSEASDCDISVYPHYDELKRTLRLDPGELRRLLVQTVTTELDGTFLPGTTHPLQYFVLPPGDNVAERFKKGVRSGWSFEDRGWINPPEKNRVHDISTEFPEVYARAAAIADKMRILLDEGKRDDAVILYKQIHAKRALDQNAGLGDFSEGNITYKFLLHEGLFARLTDEAGVHIAKTADNFSIKDSAGAQYKYSFDGTDLTVWQVNPVTGDPHHFEKIGPVDGTRAEGRIYFYGPKDIFHMVWSNRGTPYLRNMARPVVEKWVRDNLGGVVTHTQDEHDPALDKTAKTQVAYDFANDRLILFTDHEPEVKENIVVGTYESNDVHLHHTADEWINANYFKRLWLNSFPDKKLNEVYISGTHVPTRPENFMTYVEKNPGVVTNPTVYSRVTARDTWKLAKDPWRKGKDWKDYIKNKGIIVEFQIGDSKDESFEARVKEIHKDKIIVEVAPGMDRPFRDELLKEIKFRVHDEKRSLSRTAYKWPWQKDQPLGIESDPVMEESAPWKWTAYPGAPTKLGEAKNYQADWWHSPHGSLKNATFEEAKAQWILANNGSLLGHKILFGDYGAVSQDIQDNGFKARWNDPNDITASSFVYFGPAYNSGYSQGKPDFVIDMNDLDPNQIAGIFNGGPMSELMVLPSGIPRDKVQFFPRQAQVTAGFNAEEWQNVTPCPGWQIVRLKATNATYTDRPFVALPYTKTIYIMERGHHANIHQYLADKLGQWFYFNADERLEGEFVAKYDMVDGYYNPISNDDSKIRLVEYWSPASAAAYPEIPTWAEAERKRLNGGGILQKIKNIFTSSDAWVELPA